MELRRGADRGRDPTTGAGASYCLNRRLVLGGEYFGPYESEYFAREKHKVRSLADREFSPSAISLKS
jgi:hypothetical protein